MSLASQIDRALKALRDNRSPRARRAVAEAAAEVALRGGKVTVHVKHPGPALKSPRLRLLGRRGKLRIYLVDSTKARKLYADWTMGGHDAVYPDFIPRNEVWIADELGPFEQKLTTLHELHERRRMTRDGLTYDDAHAEATERESGYRKANGRGLDAALRRERGQ